MHFFSENENANGLLRDKFNMLSPLAITRISKPDRPIQQGRSQIAGFLGNRTTLIKTHGQLSIS